MTFGAELVKAMAERQVSYRRLGEMVGLAGNSISMYRSGARVPTIARADQLAEALQWPELRSALRNELRRRCTRCRKTYFAEPKNRKWMRYCGRTCRTAVLHARQNGKRVAATRPLNARYKRAIRAMCTSCESDGICRDATCPIQAGKVSPFPFIPLSDVNRRRVAA